MIHLEIANQQTTLALDRRRLRRAVEGVLRGAAIAEARISLAVVDDPTIHALNRQYLRHDYATDVLSFVLERSDGHLEGEVIVSADTAQRDARTFGWTPADELLLYVIHGMLHLVGYVDDTSRRQAEMRDKEREHLARFGLEPRYDLKASPHGKASTSKPGRNPRNKKDLKR